MILAGFSNRQIEVVNENAGNHALRGSEPVTVF